MLTELETTVSLESSTSGLIEFKIGDIVGETYELLSVLAQGGMGVLFRARHITLDQVYALKIISPNKLNETSWKRFEQEGRVLGQLNCANIVQIYNMGIDKSGCPFYVMELLQGESLAEFIQKQEKLTLDQFIDIFVQVCTGLEQVHLKEFVHRDIKPSNLVLLQKDDKITVKIVDFGIVRQHSTEAMGQDGQGLTVQGEIFGSPLYMSPEQSSGAPIELQSDIYSLGCTMYEAISGQPPFKGATAFETLLMQQEAQPASLERDDIRADVLTEISHIIEKAMKKNPQQRFQSAKDLSKRIEALKALRATGNGQGIRGARADEEETKFGAVLATPPAPEPAPPSTVRPMLLAGLAVLVIGGIGTLVLQPGSRQSKADIKARQLAPAASNAPLEPVASKGSAAISKAKVDAVGNTNPLFVSSRAPITKIVVGPRGNKIRKFSLDADYTIGEFYGGSLVGRKDRGEFETTDLKPVNFSSDAHIKSLPDIYKRFDDSAIAELRVNDAAILPDMAVLKNWKNLSNLQFEDTALLKPGYVKGFGQLKKLEHLTFVDSKYPPKDLIASGVLPRLTSLRLIDAPYKEILPVLSNCKKLNKLSLRGLTLDTKEWKQVAALKIADLDLSRTTVTRQNFIDLSKMTNLRHLSLAKANFKPEDLNLLTKCRKLIYLKSDDRPEMDSAYQALFKKMPRLQTSR